MRHVCARAQLLLTMLIGDGALARSGVRVAGCQANVERATASRMSSSWSAPSRPPEDTYDHRRRLTRSPGGAPLRGYCRVLVCLAHVHTAVDESPAADFFFGQGRLPALVEANLGAEPPRTARGGQHDAEPTRARGHM